MRGINYLRSQERWGFWAGYIATCEDAMITASDALNSFREKIRVRWTREGNPVLAVALVREAVGKYPSLGGRGETVLNSICILFLKACLHYSSFPTIPHM